MSAQHTYTVTLADQNLVSPHAHIEEMENAISDMAFVFNFTADIAQNPVGKDGKLSLKLVANEEFAALVENTAGVESIKKHAHTPCCGGCRP